MTEIEKWYRDFRLAHMHDTVTPQDIFTAGFEIGKQKCADFMNSLDPHKEFNYEALMLLGNEKVPDETQ